MPLKRKCFTSVLALLLTTFLSAQTAFASNVVLKNGMRGDDVYSLQMDLYKLGYMTVKPTGYYGSITKAAVFEMQSEYSLIKDGIAGKQTLGVLDSLMGRKVVLTEATETATTDTEKSEAVKTDATTAETTSRSASRSAESIIDYAKRFMGVSYVWGGTTVNGFDCSGFTKYVYGHFDVSIARNSRAQAGNGTYIKKSDLLPGDLVFFDTNGGKNRINHVGIYIGSGKMIHCSSSHKGVVISTINSGFYSKTYMTARRVL